MKIKSLLIASAAALAGVSGAKAADAIVAAEPEPMEYVRVCDAFGTGYFYIPGTETCLKIGGYIRFQVDFGNDSNDVNEGDWDAWTRGRLAVTSKSDTELGELTGFIAIHAEASQDSTSAVTDPFYFDEVYLSLGGFKAGTYLNWWDANDLPGELDDLGSNRLTAISYTYTGSAFTAGLQIDEISNAIGAAGDAQNIGIEAVLQAALGPAKIELLGSYDNAAEEGSIRGIGSVAAGPGTFYLSAIWSSDPNTYYASAEWTVAAAYAWDVTDKLQVIPEFQYFWNSLDAAGEFDGDDFWRAGATVNYKITDGLSSKVAVNYSDATDDWAGIVRLQRDF
ncbi:porin [Rhizobium sp. CF080]|uniref:porin n=1 Tax=Rhizobium sp. (strain CF080) TaxID=1144310 RepID=UPI0002719A73|nr:porin [Rhizobium sp. CF080]EUB95177.1 porin [Rhizobium sp. CF080]